MRNSLGRVAIFGVGALATFTALPVNEMAVAYADEDSFLADMADMEAAGFSNGGGNGAEIGVGFQICSKIAGGISPVQAAEELWRNSQLDQYGAGQFVGIAIRNLCPENMSA